MIQTTLTVFLKYILLCTCIFTFIQIAITLGSLSIAHTDLGNPLKSIEVLFKALEINKSFHGCDHISVAIILAKLSNAYRLLSNMTDSVKYAKQALDITESIHEPQHPGKLHPCFN